MNKPSITDATKGVAQVCLATVVVAGFFVLLIVLFWPGNAQDSTLDSARLMMLGALIAGFSSVLGYYFGSTSGSAAKTALLANSTPIPSPAIVTTTSEEGRTSTSFTAPNLQELEGLQNRLDVLKASGYKTPQESAEEEYLIRRIEELKAPTPN